MKAGFKSNIVSTKFGNCNRFYEEYRIFKGLDRIILKKALKNEKNYIIVVTECDKVLAYRKMHSAMLVTKKYLEKH